MKIISYNVNGLRAAVSKGFNEWLTQTNPDIVCLQEIKATPDQIEFSVYRSLGYQCFWMPAQKRGYSGVAIFSKPEILTVTYGCGLSRYDLEGRLLRIDLQDFSLINAYFPSGSSGENRQAYKMQWLFDFQLYLESVKKDQPNIILCGDLNICHHPIDIHNPTANKNSPGFLPEERNWLTDLLNTGFIDTFRYFNQNAHNYTWWSYRSRSRSKNLGWRIDYHLVSNPLIVRVKRSIILSHAFHSDHCPILLEIN